MCLHKQDKQGYKIPDTPEERVEAENGTDIYLTIDSSIQRFVESAIKDINEKYENEWLLIEVMDAKTGEILATGSKPSYDPNSIPADMSYYNPLISYAYEPGSTMKIYTYMCAIEKGVYNGEETYKSGSYTIGENTISDWNGEGWGIINYDTGFARSSNVGIANIIKNYLSKDELHDCFTKYGFGANTGVELSNEASGSLNFKYDIEVVTAGFGQGILTTPIQHLQALSIIANDGYMVKPHVISKIVKPDGKEEETVINKSDRIVSSSTVSKIKELMHNVISSDIGTGKKYEIDGYDIIGKTGTAQIFENGSYLKNGYILSAALMYPSNDPEIIIYAAIKKPPENNTKILSESVTELMKNIAKYKDMFDSNKVVSEINIINVPQYINKRVDNIAKNDNIIILGDGNKIINQYPLVNTKILSSEKIILLTNGSNYIMPNTIGWSRNTIKEFCNLINNSCEINGSGYVFEQSIEEGSIIDNNIIFNLQDK